MKTTAAIIEQTGEPVIVDEIDVPEPRPGQVLVDIRYSGVCHTQLLEVRGHRGEDKFLPHLLGHEGSGVVRAVGVGVTRVKEGDHVVLSWIRGGGSTVFGTTYDWNGRTVNAGPVTTLSRTSLVSESCVTKIAHDFPKDKAALIGCAVPTGAGAVFNTVNARPGDSIVVFGVGGVGACAISASATISCNPLVAVDLLPDKLGLAKELGATHTVRGDADNLAALLGEICPGGFDHAIEATGVPSVMKRALEVVKPRTGTAVIVGNAHFGDCVELDPSQFNKGKRIFGSIGGESDPEQDFPRYCSMVQSERLNVTPLITTHYGIDQINQALDDLENGAVMRPIIDMSL